jgi:hypothetical protein
MGPYQIKAFFLSTTMYNNQPIFIFNACYIMFKSKFFASGSSSESESELNDTSFSFADASDSEDEGNRFDDFGLDDPVFNQGLSTLSVAGEPISPILRKKRPVERLSQASSSSSSSSSSSTPAIAAPDLEGDRRVYYNNHDVALRRLDSLARLLGMNMGISACSAVSIVDGELVISANVSAHENTQEVLGILHQKMSVIRTALNAMVVIRHDWEENANFPEQLKILENAYLDEHVMPQLEAIGGLLQPGNDGLYATKQAFRKLACTVSMGGTEANSLSAADIEIMLNPNKTIYLLPARDAVAQDTLAVAAVLDEQVMRPVIGIFKANAAGELVSEGKIRLPLDDDETEVDKFHAEQVTAYYAKQLAKETGVEVLAQYNRKIGISMLCCRTCARALRDEGFTVRGSHELRYKGTINLFKPAPASGVMSSQAMTSPARAAAAYANQAHEKTAPRSHEGSAVKRPKNEQADEPIPNIKRSLFN